jgi:hypothetical protein
VPGPDSPAPTCTPMFMLALADGLALAFVLAW